MNNNEKVEQNLFEIKDFIDNGYQYNSWACIPNLLKYCDIDSIIIVYKFLEKELLK